jgi:hypothetical protein
MKPPSEKSGGGFRFFTAPIHQSLESSCRVDQGDFRLRSPVEPGADLQADAPRRADMVPSLRTHAAVIKRLRIFLSSPGDLIATREIAALTVAGSATDLSHFLRR